MKPIHLDELQDVFRQLNSNTISIDKAMSLINDRVIKNLKLSKDNLDIGDYVMTKNNVPIKITSHDMPDLPYELIDRKLTQYEIEDLLKSK